MKFPVVGQPKDTFIVIWTTTPWTLPANLAVAYNSKLQYVAGASRRRKITFCFAACCPPSPKNAAGRTTPKHPFATAELAEAAIPASVLQPHRQSFSPPILSQATPARFVHIAPGHGLDDYNLGRQNGLPIYSPVDDDGAFAYTNDLPVEQQMPAEMIGKSILEKHGKSDANEAVLHELRVRHALLHQENYHHSYPHCWRSKTPIIFRAMDQWFIKIDHVVSDTRHVRANPFRRADDFPQPRSPRLTA